MRPILCFIDWQSFLWGEVEAKFLLDIFIRCIFMFVVILISLRWLGKRAVKQISIFELVVIIAVGSAAGDSMLQPAVGLIPAAVVIAMVALCYKFITNRVASNEKFEEMMEGKPSILVLDGKLVYENFLKEPFAYDEFFSEMREKGVSHLGQVKIAYIETSGNVSVFFFPDKEVKPGLPILPDVFDSQSETVANAGIYACGHCGETEPFEKPGKKTCKKCKNQTWVEADDSLRVT